MTPSFDDVSRMLLEVARSIGAADLVAFDAIQSWAIALDSADAETIVFDLSPQAGKLFVTARVGQPPEDRRLETYARLLEINGFWPDTGGARFALDAADGTLTMIDDVLLHDLDAGHLETVVKDVAENARMIRSLVAVGWKIDPPQEDGPVIPGNNSAIRA
ncbi:MAG: type III secretion system chaperone [Pseudomonadota bacterium]